MHKVIILKIFIPPHGSKYDVIQGTFLNHIQKIEPYPNSCQYPLINYLEKNTSSWGKLSLGGVKDPKPWEKLQIGVIGAPLKLGQVRKNMLIKQSINLIHKRLQNKATITLLLGLKCRK